MRWKLTIEYKGTGYAGWQRQEGAPSIQQKVEEALKRFCGQELSLFVAGRTDAGVHAKGQIAHFDLDYGQRPLTGFLLTRALNAHLQGESIAVLKAEKVKEDFHARYDATGKLYLYRIVNREAFLTFDKNLAWQIRRPLDLDAMRDGAAHLIGRHDFSSFRAAECQAKSPVKTLDSVRIEEEEEGPSGREIKLFFEAKSFLHHQVRNMVGSLVKVGEGKWPPERIKEILESKNRSKAGPTCPPDGLYLMRVDYGP